jgi:hypothetical protein
MVELDMQRLDRAGQRCGLGKASKHTVERPGSGSSRRIDSTTARPVDVEAGDVDEFVGELRGHASA